MTHSVHNKTQKAKGKREGICRYYPPALAHEIARFLLLAKPLELRFLHAARIATADASTFLFTRHGCKMTSDHLTDCFTRVFTLHGENLGFLDYRNVSIALFRADYQNPDPTKLFAARQAGHSITTDMSEYAFAASDILTLQADQEWEFWKISTSWHKLLSLS